MPFDLFISHAPSFSKVDKPGLLRRQKAITAEQFGQLFSPLSPTMRPNGELWLQHPEDGSPWLATRLTPQGSIVLSCSYTSHRYVRNFIDAFDLGVKVASALEASLYEEVRQTRVDGANVETLLDVNGDYVQLQASTFANAIQKMHQESGAPLEYPMGPIDLVGEYFVLHLTLPPDAPTTLEKLLGRASFITPVQEVQDSCALFHSPSGTAAVKVLLRPDGKIQIWPSHGEASFAETAMTCLATLDALQAAFPKSTAAFFGEPLNDALRKEVSERAAGLGIEFYAWMQERHRA